MKDSNEKSSMEDADDEKAPQSPKMRKLSLSPKEDTLLLLLFAGTKRFMRKRTEERMVALEGKLVVY